MDAHFEDVYRMKIIVKRIPCHDDQIRLQFGDPFYKAFQKNFVCVIAQMQIGNQGNLQSVMSAAAFGRGDIPGCCVELFWHEKIHKKLKKRIRTPVKKPVAANISLE